MNKNELIEKAVLKFNGAWPTDEFEAVDTSRWQEAIIYCIRTDKEASADPDEIHCGGTGFDPNYYELICTREEFNAAADRMRGKPYWSSAPEWAQWLAQESHGSWNWFQNLPKQMTDYYGWNCEWTIIFDSTYAGKGQTIGDWRNTLEKRPEQKVEAPVEFKITDAHWENAPVWAVDIRNRFGKLHYTDGHSHCKEVEGSGWCKFYSVAEHPVVSVRPVAPAKLWFEAGKLPPVGTVCEYEFKNPSYSWTEVVVKYISDQNAILIIADSDKEVHACAFKPKHFRPIKTDKQKAIEAACSTVKDSDHHLSAVFEQLYDAGLLRLPDNKKPD